MQDQSKPILQNVDEIIECAGGTTAVARRFGRDPRVVSNWRKRGFPPATFTAWQKILSEIGVSAPAELWKQKQV